MRHFESHQTEGSTVVGFAKVGRAIEQDGANIVGTELKDVPETSGFSPEKAFTTVDEGNQNDEVDGQTPSPEKINCEDNSKNN